MKRKSADSIVVRFVAISVATILVLMPFHAFLTVWLNSGLGHYTALRLWKEFLLLLVGVGAVYLLCKSARLKSQLYRSWLWRLIGLFTLVTVAWGLVAYANGGVTLKAVLYGGLLDIRPFAILLIAWVAATYAPWLYQRWQKLVLWPAAGVIAIGLVQRFALPYDFMKHFGYNENTIWPYETIDHKTSYIRIRSTLRGANLLGGYLLIILAVLGDLLFSWRRKILVAGALTAALVALYASGSRGAWLGAVPAAGVLLWLRLATPQARKRMVVLVIAGLLVLSGAVVVLRDNDYVQNTFFHTDENSTSSVSSNSAHINYSIDAAKEIVTEPLGRGPGTAGPAGVYNAGHPARIAENNFLQIGQETGWLGLGLFIAIYYLLAKAMWRRRQLPLAQILLASFVGLTVMALLMHIWTDDTIAYLWFGLAGILLAQPMRKYAKAA
jgi:hypothetical protein